MSKPITLLPGVTLRCFPDDRFKHACLSIQLVRPMCREEAALNALLPAVLLRGCREYPDMRAITRRLDDLYGAGVGTLVRRVGDCQTTGLYASFIEDRFALSGDAILQPMTAFLGSLLFRPVLQESAFLPEFVESEKTNLIATIEAQLNDKRGYAMEQLLKAMCRGDSYGVPRLGEKEDVAAITPQSLYAHYRAILEESPVHICYVGSARPEQVAQWMEQLLSGLPRGNIRALRQTPLSPAQPSDLSETMQVSQGKLCMGFTTPVTISAEGFPAMQVFNTLFGGGMTSKLFVNLREKNSLCYAIGSSYYGAKGMLTVSAGIDSAMDAAVREQILEQLEACRRGEITDEELQAAREALRSGLRSVSDSPGAMENYYATAALSGQKLSPEEYIRAVEQVTAQQVAQVAKTLQLHTVYFLKGVSQ